MSPTNKSQDQPTTPNMGKLSLHDNNDPMEVDNNEPSMANKNQKGAAKPTDPRIRKALDAYQKMKSDVEAIEQAYNDVAAEDSIASDEKKKRLTKLKEAQAHLEESRQAWRNQHPTRLEFLSKEEVEIEKQRRANRTVIVPKDLPVLQLAGGYKWNPRKVVHNSAAAFIRAFERELNAHGPDPENDWKRLLSRSLNDPQYLWLKNQLTNMDEAITWERVSKMIIKKYDTQVQKYRAMRRVVRLQQGPNESLHAYIMKFQQLALEAEMPTGLLLIIIFLSSLQPKVSEQALLTIVNKHGSAMPEDLEDVCQLVSAMKVTETGERRGRDDEADEFQPAFKKQKGGKPQNCHHCKATWSPGHKCREFYENKAKAAAAANTNNKKKPYVQRGARLNKATADIDTLPCKSMNKKHNEEVDEILTPITIEGHRIKALVDTGANFTILSHRFVKEAQIKYKEVFGNITLAFKGAIAPRIGITEPLSVVYNGKRFIKTFEIMDLARDPQKNPRTEPVLGTCRLSRYGTIKRTD